MTSPEEMLVRGANGAGDLVGVTPASRVLRESFPDARISLVPHRGLAARMGGTPRGVGLGR